jgi:transposase
MLGIVVHSAAVQDRDGAEALLRQVRRTFPFIEVIFADAGYQGPIMAATVANTGRWRLEIVKRNEVPRFEVVPKRWIVERSLAWISHFRRMARDFERYARTVVAFTRLAMIRLMLRPRNRPVRLSITHNCDRDS